MLHKPLTQHERRDIRDAAVRRINNRRPELQGEARERAIRRWERKLTAAYLGRA